MVSEIHKNIVIGSRSQGLARSHVGVDLFSLEDLEEDVWPDAATDIVLGHAVVDIGAVGVVDDLAGGGVLLVVGDVIVHHDNDVVIRHPVTTDDLVGVTHVSLVTIVEPSVTAGH